MISAASGGAGDARLDMVCRQREFRRIATNTTSSRSPQAEKIRASVVSERLRPHAAGGRGGTAVAGASPAIDVTNLMAAADPASTGAKAAGATGGSRPLLSARRRLPGGAAEVWMGGGYFPCTPALRNLFPLLGMMVLSGFFRLRKLTVCERRHQEPCTCRSAPYLFLLNTENLTLQRAAAK